MPQPLNLKQDQRAEILPDYVGRRLQPFAIHAIACINVHDKLKAEGQNKTLPELCAVDPVLSQQEVVVERYMLCSFGRNSLPVFQRILEKECHQTQELYTPQVAEAERRLLAGLR